MYLGAAPGGTPRGSAAAAARTRRAHRRRAAAAGRAAAGRGRGRDRARRLRRTLVTRARPSAGATEICRRWRGPVVLAVTPRGSPPPALPARGRARARRARSSSRASRARPRATAARARQVRARLLRRGRPRRAPAGWPAAARRRRPRRRGSVPREPAAQHALRAVATTHYLMVDVDFWPTAARACSPRPPGGSTTRSLVVPAFEHRGRGCASMAQCRASMSGGGGGAAAAGRRLLGELPRVPAAARRGSRRGRLRGLPADNNRDGHATTDTRAWLSQAGEREVRELPCFASNRCAPRARRAPERTGRGRSREARSSLPSLLPFSRYEPYLVVRAGPPTPLYDERFTGYGKNKIEHVTHLRWAGWRFAVLPPRGRGDEAEAPLLSLRFAVLPRGAITHFPHPISDAKRAAHGPRADGRSTRCTPSSRGLRTRSRAAAEDAARLPVGRRPGRRGQAGARAPACARGERGVQSLDGHAARARRRRPRRRPRRRARPGRRGRPSRAASRGSPYSRATAGRPRGRGRGAGSLPPSARSRSARRAASSLPRRRAPNSSAPHVLQNWSVLAMP